MGKKYIIEMEDLMFHKTGESGADAYLWRVKGFNSLVFDRTGISKLTPYTEPDLEKIKKEAYEKGRKDVETQFCSYDACKNRQEEYQRGLADAWEAARGVGHCKLWGDYTKDTGKTSVCVVDVLDHYSASEAIAKIKEYEQNEIQVGDEVIAPMGVAVITEITDECFHFIHADGSYGFDYKKDAPRKTGRHFPEIATVLQKMMEGQEQ